MKLFTTRVRKYCVQAENRVFRFENGRIYFSQQVERKIFFILTLAVLGWCVLGWIRN